MLDIDEGNLKQGMLGLVIALVEIIKDASRPRPSSAWSRAA